MNILLLKYLIISVIAKLKKKTPTTLGKFHILIITVLIKGMFLTPVKQNAVSVTKL